jgi:hypothetical protein
VSDLMLPEDARVLPNARRARRVAVRESRPSSDVELRPVPLRI